MEPCQIFLPIQFLCKAVGSILRSKVVKADVTIFERVRRKMRFNHADVVEASNGSVFASKSTFCVFRKETDCTEVEINFDVIVNVSQQTLLLGYILVNNSCIYYFWA